MTSRSKNVQLLIIDPQNDFCDQQHGALKVTGADQDMQRLADLIRRSGDKIDHIHVTLDSHHPIHVAHPIYWTDVKGRHPPFYTKITANEVREGQWAPTHRNWLRNTRDGFGALDYVESLEKNGKFPLSIWPPHCLIGSWGQNIFPPLFDALRAWEEQNLTAVHFVTKGSNWHTENYSAICADVPDPHDPMTQLNTALLDELISADEILLAGEAASHCLANTAVDADAYFEKGEFARKLVLLSDATSCIENFEDQYEKFLATLGAKGMRLMKTSDFAND